MYGMVGWNLLYAICLLVRARLVFIPRYHIIAIGSIPIHTNVSYLLRDPPQLVRTIFRK